jgi:predicted house-cleaning NTP pyrophosphatase (Maf/HAM1 superfamily)
MLIKKCAKIISHFKFVRYNVFIVFADRWILLDCYVAKKTKNNQDHEKCFGMLLIDTKECVT